MKYLYPILLLLLLSACTRYEVNCSNEGMSFRLIGFSAAEADTVIIRRYFRSTGLQQKDSIFFVTTTPHTGDTLQISKNFGADSLDMTVSIPSLGRTVAITEITSNPPGTQTYRRSILSIGGKSDGCVNSLLSYKIDGRKVDVSHDPANYTIIDIIR